MYMQQEQKLIEKLQLEQEEAAKACNTNCQAHLWAA
jgi:hypothetical protein